MFNLIAAAVEERTKLISEKDKKLSPIDNEDIDDEDLNFKNPSPRKNDFLELVDD